MTTPTRSLPEGRRLLGDPRFNRGTAFTEDERRARGLEGLLPAGVLSLEVQARRSYEQYGAQPTDLAKNDFLAALHDRNEVLYHTGTTGRRRSRTRRTTREALCARRLSSSAFRRPTSTGSWPPRPWSAARGVTSGCPPQVRPPK